MLDKDLMAKFRWPIPRTAVVPLNALLGLAAVFAVPLSLAMWLGTLPANFVLGWAMLMLTGIGVYFLYAHHHYMTTNPEYLQSEAFRAQLLRDNRKQGAVIDLKAETLVGNTVHQNTVVTSTLSPPASSVFTVKTDEGGKS